MKIPRPIICLLLAAGTASSAFASAGVLTSPSLAFPKDFSASTRTHILAALQPPPKGKFLGGEFVNSSTTLRYSGDTSALNQFLSGLAKCPGASLLVGFSKTLVPDDCDWMVSHNAVQEGTLFVYINLKSSRIDLEQLSIPESKGPPAPVGQ
jgi:hypothetical protein